MFTELFKPVVNAVHPVTINEVRHNIQKERRIIDTLILNAHKMVIDRSVIKDDYHSVMSYPIESQSRYMLIHQLSRITAKKRQSSSRRQIRRLYYRYQLLGTANGRACGLEHE